MRFLKYLSDVVSRQSDLTFAEWCEIEDAEARKRAARSEEREERLREHRELREARKALEDIKRKARRTYESETTKAILAAQMKEAQEAPERLAGDLRSAIARSTRPDPFEVELDSLRRQVAQKKAGIRQELALEELAEKLASAEAAVKAERYGVPPKGEAANQPVAPFLSEEQMQSMAQKAFAHQLSRPEKTRLAGVSQWREELEGRYGDLIADELADKLMQMLKEV